MKLLLVVLTLPLASSGPENVPGALASFHAARGALARAVAHYGGQERIGGMESLRACWRRTLYHDLQAQEPGLAHDEIEPGRTDSCVTLDLAGDRAREDLETELSEGYVLSFGSLELEGVSYTLIPEEEQFVRHPVSRGSVHTVASWFVPQLLLRRALQRIPSLRTVGEVKIDASLAVVLEFLWDERNRYRLAIAKDGGRLLGLEFPRTDTLHGVDTFALTYFDEAEFDGLLVPTRVEWRRRGHMYIDATLERLQIGPRIPDESFSIPSDYDELPHTGPPVRVEIAPEVSEIRRIDGFSYRTPVIEFDDFLVAFDAPIAPFVTARALAQMQAEFPGKPLRYVVLSHYHEDHVGGLRTYVEAGAKVVTTRGNEKFLTRLVNADYALFDLEAPGPLEIDFVFVEDEYEITDGNVRAVVRTFPDSRHVRDMLVTILPGEKLLINGDLFSMAVPFNVTFSSLLEWLDDETLDVETVLGVHHPPRTVDELRALQREWLAGGRDGR